MRILILGGTTQARLLAERLANEPSLAPILSLAGRTKNPALPDIAVRIGGFGGPAGLVAYLESQSINLVIDATHPFAERMSAHAQTACRAINIPCVIFSRPPWQAQKGDLWIEVENANAAARALGERPRRVFLTTGRLQLAAFEAAPLHDYLIRSIDPPRPDPNLPRYRLILARGPFSLEDELALLEREKIDILVSKNSGGEATYAKIEAARKLGIPVVMVSQPLASQETIFHDISTILTFIKSHQNAPDLRGV